MIGGALLFLPNLKIRTSFNLLLGIGRGHALVLHFPIVLILLTFIIEMSRLYFNAPISNRYVLILLISSAISSFISVGTGILLNASGEYSGSLITDHLWAGSITSALMWLALALFGASWLQRSYYFWYCLVLLTAVVGTTYTGHLGGSVTHGHDYLVAPFELLNIQKDHKLYQPSSDPKIYEDLLAPVFEAKCISCHNNQRAKGGLSMASFRSLFQPGESGLPSLTPFDTAKSEIYKRLILPASHKDHMPPDGKTPMTDDEISLLKYWIYKNAEVGLPVADVIQDTIIGPVIDRILPSIKQYQYKMILAKKKVKQYQLELLQLSPKVGVQFEVDEEYDGNLFSIHTAFPPSLFDNNQLPLLKPYFELFSSVSLISSGIDDDGLYYIGQMTNLRALYLQKTKIEGAGLVYLQNLPNLEVLNLSYTLIDDKTAMDLLKFPKLKEVYLYRTNTSKEVAAVLTKYKPGLRVLLEEGPYY